MRDPLEFGRRHLAALLYGWVALAGCSDATVSDSADAGDATSASSVVVSFVRPTDDEAFELSVAAAGVPVVLEVQGISLATGGDGVALSLDGAPATTLRALTGTVVVTEPGLHVLGAQAVKGDGSAYEGSGAKDSVTFSVVSACTTDGECADKNPCSTEACEEGLCSYEAVAGCCLTAAECGEGEVCANNRCEQKNILLCKTDSDCTGKLVSPAVLGPCQLEACNGDACELVVRDEQPCDDGNPCTGSGTCAGTICTPGPALSCNDNDPCTDDACVDGGCVGTPNTAPCDDGDPCSLGDVCSQGVCSGTPDPECVPPLGEPICVVTGAADAEVVCPFRLVRIGQSVALPAALQMTVLYDANRIAFVRFEDESCIGGPCQLMSTPPVPLWPSGHSVSLSPGDAAAWAGKGSVVIANISDPTAPISDAYLDPEGAIQGDPQFVQAVFKRKVDGTDPVTLSNVVLANAAAESIPSVVSEQKIVVGDAATSIAAAACAMTGDALDQIDCPVRLAAVSSGAPPATALELVMDYPKERARIIGFFDELCFEGVGCFDQVVAGQGALPLSTGHQVSIAPTTFEGWSGSGAAIIVHPGAPHTPLTEAWYNEAGALVGDPVVFRARFELLSPAPASAPVLVTLDGVAAADADAFSLPVTVTGGIIVSGEP